MRLEFNPSNSGVWFTDENGISNESQLKFAFYRNFERILPYPMGVLKITILPLKKYAATKQIKPYTKFVQVLLSISIAPIVLLAISSSLSSSPDMVIPPPVKAQRITNYLKPYLLKMHFTNKYVSAQVIHSPTATVATAASSQEKALHQLGSTRDVAAAARIGKLLGERLLVKDIPTVSMVYKKDQRYHGKVRAVIDSLWETGVKLL